MKPSKVQPARGRGRGGAERGGGGGGGRGFHAKQQGVGMGNATWRGNIYTYVFFFHEFFMKAKLSSGVVYIHMYMYIDMYIDICIC